MKPSLCMAPYDRRSAQPSVDGADIISLVEALARGMKPIEAVCMTQYMISLKSTRKPQKTKAELYEMLAEAVRNTAQSEPRPKRAKTKTDRGKKVA
jgi:hypothetical protein